MIGPLLPTPSPSQQLWRLRQKAAPHCRAKVRTMDGRAAQRSVPGTNNESRSGTRGCCFWAACTASTKLSADANAARGALLASTAKHVESSTRSVRPHIEWQSARFDVVSLSLQCVTETLEPRLESHGISHIAATGRTLAIHRRAWALRSNSWCCSTSQQLLLPALAREKGLQGKPRTTKSGVIDGKLQRAERHRQHRLYPV